MLATLLDQFPVTGGQLTPEEFAQNGANMQSKHAARLSKTAARVAHFARAGANPSQCPPWQRLALQSRVCARESLRDSLKAVGYLSSTCPHVSMH